MTDDKDGGCHAKANQKLESRDLSEIILGRYRSSGSQSRLGSSNSPRRLLHSQFGLFHDLNLFVLK